MSWKEQEEYSEWNVKEYEDYLARPKDDFGYNRMWDVAKYNPYAAYMFARRMENGEIDDQACHYLSRSAEYGCSRAFWRLVTNHPGEIGVRNLCVVFDRCVGFREDVYGREQRLVRTAEGLAEDHPVLWTVLAYYSLCRRDLEAFDGYSAKACQIGDVHSMYMRAYRLLEAAVSARRREGRQRTKPSSYWRVPSQRFGRARGCWGRNSGLGVGFPATGTGRSSCWRTPPDAAVTGTGISGPGT